MLSEPQNGYSLYLHLGTLARTGLLGLVSPVGARNGEPFSLLVPQYCQEPASFVKSGRQRRRQIPSVLRHSGCYTQKGRLYAVNVNDGP